MRQLLTALPVTLLFAVGLVVADNPPGRPSSGKPKPAAQADGGTFGWDVDEFLKMYDKDKDGSLSRDELPEHFRHNFAKLDTNKDGKLSREELRSGMMHLQPQRRTSDVVFYLVEMSDCDECCAEELQRIYTFLRKLDVNQDGTIHADELKAAREGLVKARVDRIMNQLDADKDGKISRDEAKGQIKKYFTELDANKDGFIDRTELMRGAAEKPRKVSPRKDGSPTKAGERPTGN